MAARTEKTKYPGIYRCHSRGWPTEDALAELESGAGTQFDAELAELFASLVRGDT
jgi:HD-GYP domain-containing protein (c-di-GMP phosphodiesterase class II)